MTFKTLAAFGVAVLAFPVAALAQTPPPGDWTGFYVGGRLGLSEERSNKNETVLFDTDLNGSFDDTVNTAAGANAFSPGFCNERPNGPTAAAGCRSDRMGTDWAAHVGFDYQMGALVVGLVGEYGHSTGTDSVTAFSTTPANYVFERRLRDNAALRARAGVDLGNTLVYGTGGIAWGKIRNSFTSSNTANTFTRSGDESEAWGHRVGGGIEQRISPRFSIGAQYLLTSLKDDDPFVVRAGGPVPATNPFVRVSAGGTDLVRSSTRFNSHSAHVTANFRF